MVVHLGAFKSQLVATIVPHIYIYIYVYWTHFVLGLVWFCMYGIQFPTDPLKDHFLSSVISMVAPTWCHGPIGGNPLWETVD